MRPAVLTERPIKQRRVRLERSSTSKDPYESKYKHQVTARSIRRDLIKQAKESIDPNMFGNVIVKIETPPDNEETGLFNNVKRLLGLAADSLRTQELPPVQSQLLNNQELRIPFHVSKDTVQVLRKVPGVAKTNDEQVAMDLIWYNSDDKSNATDEELLRFPGGTSLETDEKLEEEYNHNETVKLCLTLPQQNSKQPYDYSSIIPQEGQTISFTLASQPMIRWQGMVYQMTHFGTRHVGRRTVVLEVSQIVPLI